MRSFAFLPRILALPLRVFEVELVLVPQTEPATLVLVQLEALVRTARTVNIKHIRWRVKYSKVQYCLNECVYYFVVLNLSCQDVGCCADQASNCSGFAEGFPCFCDATCTLYNDCCFDYTSCLPSGMPGCFNQKRYSGIVIMHVDCLHHLRQTPVPPIRAKMVQHAVTSSADSSVCVLRDSLESCVRQVHTFYVVSMSLLRYLFVKLHFNLTVFERKIPR